MLRPNLRKVHMSTYTLRTYLDDLPRGGIAELATKLGISNVYLLQLAARQDGRKPSPELCVQIEQVTDGKVGRRELRPDDWRAIWPELERRTKQRPANNESDAPL